MTAIDPDWPRVSVVIPTYNRARLLVEAIDSVLAQNYPRLEVIVVDDGSTDETPAVVAGYGTAVRFFRQANAGAAHARNRGIELATGELVAFLDSDDLYLPGKLLEQARQFQADPALVMVYGWFSILDDQGRTRLGRRCGLSGRIGRALLSRCMQGPVATPTVMVRRDALQAVGGFDETMHLSEDIDLWCRLARRGPVGLIPRVLVEVRRHAGNLSRGPGRKRYLAAALRILDKARIEDPSLSPIYLARLRAKAHVWSWLVAIGGWLPVGASFWLRALLTNPRVALARWFSSDARRVNPDDSLPAARRRAA
jgi:glycosyltransferase involved in cell wall biosynthesis